MNKATKITIFILLVFIGGFLIFYNSKPVPISSENDSAVSDTQQKSGVSNTQQKWESKIDEQASVTVTVTPSDSLVESKEWKFNVVMDTHSIELDQDMTKISILVDDQGKEYKPINWEGPVGGHHREGVLIFNQITPTPKSIELKISGIGNVIRNFAWQL
ncbi:MAG: hypothetical protein AAB868_02295 [Patescibacteria group bacterium]